MEFAVKNELNVEVGDIILVDKTKLRMIITDEEYYAALSLDGEMTTDWQESIESLLEIYGEVTEIYKNKDLKIVRK